LIKFKTPSFNILIILQSFQWDAVSINDIQFKVMWWQPTFTYLVTWILQKNSILWYHKLYGTVYSSAVLFQPNLCTTFFYLTTTVPQDPMLITPRVSLQKCIIFLKPRMSRYQSLLSCIFYSYQIKFPAYKHEKGCMLVCYQRAK
jgi:hypothetical protein